MMSEILRELARKIGVAPSFSAIGIGEVNVSDDLLSYLCTALGFDVKGDKKIQKALDDVQNRPYFDVLAPVYVVRQNNKKIDIYIKKSDFDEAYTLEIKAQNAKKYTPLAYDKHLIEERVIEREAYQKIGLNILKDIDIGYYDLRLTLKGRTYYSVMAVAPEKCYNAEVLENKKAWGFAIQLYAIKSRRNWGIGDFTDLAEFASIAAENGADIIGLNPLHVLMHDFPENASPYSSISRFYLNPIYIDVEKTAGFDAKIKKDIQKEIDSIKKQNLIDYSAVYNLKIKVLYELFKKKLSSKAFENFKKQGGEKLHLFALYQAIYHSKCKSVWGGWRAWPEGLKNKAPMDVVIFEAAHADEIEFFKFLQFEASRQFEAVANDIAKLGMKIGLYRDLPVGVSKDSAELWADEKAYIKGSGAGAPPDVFFREGQKWCLGAFDPFELKRRAYQPFLDILRANMKSAGALRMDHVMSLMRLFMIKDDGDEGTYIYYNFEDMLSLVALESVLNKCVIVGESIGNVPEGFVETLQKNNIYSMSVLWGERWDNGAGDFKAPEFYPPRAFASIGTHDMPPLKMWWFGYEIELKYKLKMIDEAERLRLYKERENDRWKLLKVLDENGVWPKDNLRRNNYLYGESYPEGLTEAVHQFLAKSESKVVVLQIEDILGVSELQNLPGTDRDKYPNWRHKWPVDLEDLPTNTDFIRNIKAVKEGR